MKCLPALRSGQAGWLFPLSVPAGEFLAALLMKVSAREQRMRRETISLPQLDHKSVLAESGDDSEGNPWVARSLVLLRSDWSLRWYVALRWCDQQRENEDLQAKRFLPSDMDRGESVKVFPQIGLNELACWLIQHACDWFGGGDLRLFTEQAQARLSPKWYERWQQAAEKFFISEGPARIFQGPESLEAEHKLLCELLEASGDAVPVPWKSVWPEIFDGAIEEDGPLEEEAFGGADVADARLECPPEVDRENEEPQFACEAVHGAYLGYGKSMVDLDEYARMQHEREYYRTRFATCIHDEKIASLRQLAYGLSHELNNPLAAIRTRAELLQRHSMIQRDCESVNQLQKIVDSAMRAHEMIADMMYFAKPPRLQYQREDAIRLTSEVVDEYRQACGEAAIELRFSTKDRLIVCWGDRLQLAGALRALIRNSIEAVGSSGAICVCVRKSRHQVQWIVSDSGGGMSPEARRHAFDPYYSGREAGRGLGLGLSRVYRVAQSHGGKASVVDTANLGMVGCQVRFWIPRQRPKPDGGSPS